MNPFMDKTQQGGVMNPPNLLRYSNVLPRAPASTSKTLKMPAVNGGEFSYDRNDTIRIAIQADAFLSPQESYIQFDITNDSATDINPQGSINSVIQSYRLLAANVEIDRINDYGVLMSMLSDFTLSKEYRESTGALVSGYASNSTFGEIISLPAINVPDFNAANIGVYFEQNDGHPQIIGPGASRTYSIPLICFLGGAKYIPLSKLKNNQLILELELARPEDAFVSVDDTVRPAYSVKNVNYHATLVYFDGTFNAAFDEVLARGMIQFHSTTYKHHQSQAADGSYTFPIPERASSIKAIYCIQRDVGFITGAGDYSKYRTCARTFDGIQDYQFQVGPTMYPQQPVKTVDASGYGSEAYGELMKALGLSLNSVKNNGTVVNENNYTAPSQRDAVGSIEVPATATAGDIAAFLAAPFDYAAYPLRLGKFAFGIDTESMTRSDPELESGLNTRSLSLPINCIVSRVGTVGVNLRLDAFVLVDQVITLLPDGALKVEY